jgi:hypothetical protein
MFDGNIAHLGALVTACATLLACSDGGSSAAPNDAGIPDAADAGVAPDASDAVAPLPLTKESIQFQAEAPLPLGEMIVANDWASPDRVFAMRPDGSDVANIFRARRVWAMNASRDGKLIAFSVEDPSAEARYGVSIGDAIQNTWLYDATTQGIRLIGSGNVNDECHVFSPDNRSLFVCRRYEFTAKGDFKGWRIGRIDVASGDFTFLTTEADRYALHPHFIGSQLVHTFIDVSRPTMPAYSVVARDPASSPATTIHARAGRAVFAPGATLQRGRYVFTDYANARQLMLVVDGGTPTRLRDEAAGVAWSPDGKRIVYGVEDRAANCRHLEVMSIDPPAAPARVLDCAAAKRFITTFTWIARPS